MGENSRIKIKMGPVEVEYEGTEMFLKDELLDMVKAVSELYRESGGSLKEQSSGTGSGGEGGTGGSGGAYTGTTNQIATSIGAASGPGLIKAAAAKLHFVDGKDTFSRNDLLAEAKKVTRLYKENHRKNLSNTLTTFLSNGTFNEPSDKNYALTDATIKEIEPKLGK